MLEAVAERLYRLPVNIMQELIVMANTAPDSQKGLKESIGSIVKTYNKERKRD